MIRVMGKRKYLLRARLTKSLALIFILAAGMSSCIVIPYEPGAEVSSSDKGHMPLGEMMVTVGPRELLEEISEEIAKADAQIEITDPVVFRDAAFPDGDWRISRLLEKGNCRRVSSELGVEYLVLIGEIIKIQGEDVGGVVIYIGFYGAGYGEEEVRLSATIIDLKSERHLYDVSSAARGVSGGVGLFYGLFIIPMTESGAIEGLGREIAKTIRNNSARENIKVAVLALEHLGEEYLLEKQSFASQQLKEKQEQEQEQVQSQYLLAMDSGNNRKRRKLLCQSAIKGHQDAAGQLGLMYAVGLDGIKPDLVEAYRWYGLAERLGYEGAAQALILLEQRMTKSQYSDVMRLPEDISNGPSCERAAE